MCQEALEVKMAFIIIFFIIIIYHMKNINNAIKSIKKNAKVKCILKTTNA